MRARIQRLTVEGVRGVLPKLVIELEGKTVLLRGDNGTGKSSIVQGLR
ncbi:MAG: AAA family ATPase, partial [Myxococcales bacterium]|nr:AAA family ATPase [Myxococcales bacterium]